MRDKPRAGRYVGAVDSGQTRDKIAAPDPAAAPLHTDAESGGRPTPAAALEGAAADQRQRPMADDAAATRDVPGRGQPQIPARGNAMIMGAAIAALIAAAVVVAYVFLPA
jgi:hypothetical protein